MIDSGLNLCRSNPQTRALLQLQRTQTLLKRNSIPFTSHSTIIAEGVCEFIGSIWVKQAHTPRGLKASYLCIGNTRAHSYYLYTSRGHCTSRYEYHSHTPRCARPPKACARIARYYAVITFMLEVIIGMKYYASMLKRMNTKKEPDPEGPSSYSINTPVLPTRTGLANLEGVGTIRHPNAKASDDRTFPIPKQRGGCHSSSLHRGLQSFILAIHLLRESRLQLETAPTANDEAIQTQPALGPVHPRLHHLQRTSSSTCRRREVGRLHRFG